MIELEKVASSGRNLNLRGEIQRQRRWRLDARDSRGGGNGTAAVDAAIALPGIGVEVIVASRQRERREDAQEQHHRGQTTHHGKG